MVTITAKGGYKKTNSFFQRLLGIVNKSILDEYGKKGVIALSENTPVNTGETADSWYYNVVRGHGFARIEWCNSNINEGVSVAVMAQYGHASKNGYFIEGQDYINPALAPVFDEMAERLWEEVKNA